MLNDYLQTVQGFLRDRDEKLMNPDDLRRYINRARREVAERTQSIRILTPVAGAVTRIQVVAPGSGYTNPTVTVTTPDAPNGAQPYPAGLQATALAQEVGGEISNISLTQGGDGYFQPQATISDPTGSGAVLAAFTSPINVTQFQQEIYTFDRVPLQTFPGVGQIFKVQSVSIIYANYRYSLPCYPFSVYQALIRQYPRQYIYVPTVMGQLGRGTNGSLYMYPIPSQPYQMEWDAFCLPADLIDDSSFEAIPQPWQDAVPYFATHLAFLELQNLNAARFYLDLHDNMVHRYSAAAAPTRMVNPYGRY